MTGPDTREGEWRRFFVATAVLALAALALLYLFVAIVDPFDDLPLSPPFDRVPVASNARFAHPALARSPAFDSAVIGTSTSRLLRPAVLDPAFGGARFVNLAMNAATAYEQSRMLELFARTHPHARFLLVGLDVAWCGAGPRGASYGPHYTPRPFPEWMYGTNRWAGYAHILNLDALEEAGREAGILLGIKREVYGRDGYTRFVPPDSQYDPVRAARHLALGIAFMPPGPQAPGPDGWYFPALERLRGDLARLPAATRVLLYFVPYYVGIQPKPGSPQAALWTACKARVASIAAARPATIAADFMIPSAITRAPDHYWDPLHTRLPVADGLARDLGEFIHGHTPGDAVLLSPAAVRPGPAGPAVGPGAEERTVPRDRGG